MRVNPLIQRLITRSSRISPEITPRHGADKAIGVSTANVEEGRSLLAGFGKRQACCLTTGVKSNDKKRKPRSGHEISADVGTALTDAGFELFDRSRFGFLNPCPPDFCVGRCSNHALLTWHGRKAAVSATTRCKEEELLYTAIDQMLAHRGRMQEMSLEHEGLDRRFLFDP
jgi:hypothetical protein